MDQSDLIQTVCQIYNIVEGERVHSRKTALIQHGSPLHPYSVCNPNYSGHEQCLPLTVDYVSPDLAPPTMAHHFYYLHIRDAKIPSSLKDDIYRELYHTAPFDLFAKYTELRSRFDLALPKECRMLMVTILDFWIQRCKRLKICLDATEFFPVRLQWTDSVFEGTQFERDQLSQNWEGGREMDEYGWAIEMVRAERVTAFTENCPLIFMGDNTSTRLARYIEWGKRLNDIDGIFLRRFGTSGWKLKESERMSDLFLVLKKIHFGHGCVAVVLSSGAHELAERMAPSKYGKILKDMLLYLLQFQLRILVLPPTPRVDDRFLWFQYLQQQLELSIKLSTVEFLVRPAQQANNRCFMDALLIGNHTLDSFVCDDAGFTDFGIKKLGFFLIEVMQIPKTDRNGQTSKHEGINAAASTRDGVIVTHDYKRENIINAEQHSPRLMEEQSKAWYQPSLDYEPIDDASPFALMPYPNSAPADGTYLNVNNYSELAGYASSSTTAATNFLTPLASGVQSSNRHRKKKKNPNEAHLHVRNNERSQGQQQHAMINFAKKLKAPKLSHGKHFTLTRERRNRHRRTCSRRVAE
uniref:Aminotransferase-like plant mobile domain-containing protein n=1 Tax=Setaria digitata TaxID=48799 RepID=A0A915Q6Q5_9BILA